MVTAPWHYAALAGRRYITPEDIQHAINAGADRAFIHSEVLKAIADNQCEDHKLCAFVAYRFEKETDENPE